MSTPALNAKQQEAVEHLNGPALVVAGAGTGKTRVIVERIVRLIESGTAPDAIVALTFTEKAAQEMLDRVNELRGGYNFDTQIATFNAFGEQLVRRYAAELGMHASLTVLNETGQTLFLKQHLAELNLDYYAPITRPDGLLGDLARYYSQLKQQMITPEVYADFCKSLSSDTAADKLEKKRHQELAQSYAAYTRLARSANVIDYDDQIYLLVNLLKSHPNVRKQLQKEIQYILVDEFQDTNPMQSELLSMLVNEQQNIMVVGDDDQSIYGFRGATIQNILGFKDAYPDTKQIVLTENYRSTQEILDTAYKLITNNNPNRLEVKNNINKHLNAQTSGEIPQHIELNSLDDEIQTTAENIKDLIDDGVNPGSIAVLMRRNTTALRVHDMLTTLDIPHQLAGQTHDLYKEPIVQALLDCLRTIHDPLDNQSAYYTLRGPLFSINDAELALIAARTRREHTQFIDEAGKASKSVQTAAKQIQQWRDVAETISVGQLVYKILSESGLKDSLVAAAEDSAEATQQVFYISQLFSQIKQYERASIRQSLGAFIDDIPLLALAGERSNDDLSDELDATSVSVLTIHKSKGLEWDHVFIIDATEGTLPSMHRKDSLAVPAELSQFESSKETHLEEERRLLYVALTRAKKSLLVSYAGDHGGKRAKKPSRFIEEAFDTEALKPQALQSQLGFDIAPESAPPSSNQLPTDMLRDNHLSLSVSQLNDFFRCPYDFYYRHILRVPQEESAGLQYGLIMHGYIERFTRKRQQGEEIDLPQMLKEMRESWPKTGFLSAVERERAIKQGLASFKDYATRELEHNRVPTHIERPFQIQIEDIRISGRYDAVYEDEDGIEIRDYKSGVSVTDDAKAKRRAQSSDQLTQYALAWQQLTGELPQKLTLDFFETNLIGSVKKTQKGIDTMTQKISDAASKIKRFEFKKGADHSFCQHP